MRASLLTLLAVSLANLPMQSRAFSVLSATSLTPENAEIVDYSPLGNTLASTISAVATGGFGVKLYTVNADGTLTERSTIAFDDATGIQVANVFSASSTALDPLGRGFGVVTLIPTNNSGTVGKIAFFDFKPTTANGAAQELKVLDVGFHPDSVKFSPDGTKIIVANEGEAKAATLVAPAVVTASATVAVSSTAAALAGMEVYGTGIPGGTTIVTVDSATQLTLSQPVTLAAAAEFNVKLPANLDAAGSISIINLTGITNTAGISAAAFDQTKVTTFDFQAANLASGVLIDGLRYNDPSILAADRYRHIEPEYPAPMNDKVYVTLQENNAIAEFTYATSKWTKITSLGTITQTIDASDRDGLSNAKAVQIDEIVPGLPMPDAIVAYEVAGQRYLITVNEGDARPDDGDINRVGSAGTLAANKKGMAIDSTVFASGINANDRLARLNISLVDGDTDTDGDIDVPTMIGTRSFTVWNATTGALVWDSGSLESLLLTVAPEFHNINNGLLTDWDTRSDDKGPEPEALTIGTYGSATLAFIGLERQNGILVYNITNPTAPVFLGYQNNLDRSIISPESLAFIPAAVSPSKVPMLVAGYEGTGLTGNGLIVSDLFNRHEVLVYKRATARTWNQDEVFNPLSTAPITRNPRAGVMKDNAYLIVDRTARSVRTIRYFDRVEDGAKIKEYTVQTNSYAPWEFTLPSGGDMEFLETLAPGVGAATVSFKEGNTSVVDYDADLDGDLLDDKGTTSMLSYLVGPAKDLSLGKKPNITVLPRVAAKLSGASREVLDALLGDSDGLGGDAATRQLFFRSAGLQTATLDTVITTKVNQALPTADATLILSDVSAATKEVQAALDKLGYDAADPFLVP